MSKSLPFFLSNDTAINTTYIHSLGPSSLSVRAWQLKNIAYIGGKTENDKWAIGTQVT
jgi:hypothetical protein